ncbi:Ribosomal protein S21 family protein [Rhynchospora pubera]|uniref:Ribosomal protein S21 family protein n=1 Tax=Rhynchospora pubera TaxID=906938 RepID=A0AAV8HI95_9POAL|nr:Ribosomal protein S21 family protein [Rhynchospora pubera]
MNRLAQRLSSLTNPFLLRHGATPSAASSSIVGAQARGIRVYVKDGNLELALGVMERRLRGSGMERLIKRRVDHHLKNTEKKVLAKKLLMLKVRSEDLGKKLRTILVKKIRGM